MELLLGAAEAAGRDDYLRMQDHVGMTALYVGALCCAMPHAPPDPAASDGAADAAAAAPASAPPAAVDTDGDEEATRLGILARLLQAGAPTGAGGGALLDAPLLVCLGAAKSAAVAALLRHGADANAMTVAAGRLPALHLALAHGNARCVELLLRHGVGAMALWQPQALRRTPLHTAAAQPRPSAAVIRLLLAHGAQPNTCDARGARPLRLMPTVDSSGAGQAELATLCEAVEALVLGGARPELKDAQGHSLASWFKPCRPHLYLFERAPPASEGAGRSSAHRSAP